MIESSIELDLITSVRCNESATDIVDFDNHHIKARQATVLSKWDYKDIMPVFRELR